MIFDSNKSELKNPIEGQIKSLNDDHGHNIEIHAYNNDSGTFTGRNNISNPSIQVDNKLDQNIVSGDNNLKSRGSPNQLSGGSDAGNAGSDAGDEN